MFNSDDLLEKTLHASLVERGELENTIKLDIIYLFDQKERPSIETMAPRYLLRIAGFDESSIRNMEDRKTIVDLISDKLDIYAPRINESQVRSAASGIRFELNELNSETSSPRNFEYRVFAEALRNFENVEKATIDPVAVLVNIYVGKGFNPHIRERVIEYARLKRAPIVLQAPEGRDEEASRAFKTIKKGSSGLLRKC